MARPAKVCSRCPPGSSVAATSRLATLLSFRLDAREAAAAECGDAHKRMPTPAQSQRRARLTAAGCDSYIVMRSVATHLNINERPEPFFPLPVIPDRVSFAFLAQFLPSCRFADENECDDQDGD